MSNTPITPSADGAKEAFLACARLVRNPDMVLLCFASFACGLGETFCLGVYNAAIGFTLRFGGDTAKYVGMSGMLFGAGGITGGILVTLTSSRLTDRGRCLLMAAGAVIVSIACICIFFNLPNEAVFGPTSEEALMETSLALALSCSFLLGVGDSVLQSAICAAVGTRFSDCSAAAFALLRFVQNLVMVASFLGSSHLGLWGQTVIFASSSALATATVWLVVRRAPTAASSKAISRKDGRS